METMPPSHQYNMYHVPLPFVILQESTFIFLEDVNIRINCPNEAMIKRQCMIHVVSNAGNGVLMYYWVDLVNKGLGKRIREEEKVRYHPIVDMIWQNMHGSMVLR